MGHSNLIHVMKLLLAVVLCFSTFSPSTCLQGQSTFDSELIASDAKQFALDYGRPLRIIATFDEDTIGHPEVLDTELHSVDAALAELIVPLNAPEMSWSTVALPSSGVGFLQFSETPVEVVDVAVKELKKNPKIVAVEADSPLFLPPNAEGYHKMPWFSTSWHNTESEEIEAVTPNDQYWSLLWGMSDIHAPEAWDIQTGAEPSVYRPVVTVIDTGVLYTHPDLQANMWVNEAEMNGIPGVDDDGNGYVDDIHGWNAVEGNGDPMDDQGHGTHCAGTIGAIGNNGIGVVGVNWRPRIQACKFLDYRGRGSTSDAITCVDYAIATSADLTSNSWGGGGFSNALRTAISRAQNANQIFVAASGNSGLDVDDDPHYPSSYSLENIVAVAALNSSDRLASFSNYGVEGCDVAAPGVGIASTYLDDWYAYSSGTSMAAPHVSGCLALMKSVNPSMGWASLIDVLENTVDPFGQLGVVKWDGKLNCFAALQNLPLPTGSPVSTTTTTTTTMTTTMTTTGSGSSSTATTTAVASTTTTTSTVTAVVVDPMLVFGNPQDTCFQICLDEDKTCHEDETSLLFSDLDECYSRTAEERQGEYVIRGFSGEFDIFPSGCFLTFTWMFYRANINTNSFGSGEMGCLAPGYDDGSTIRPCVCY